MLKYAEWYYKYGWKIIPSREKKPLVEGFGADGDLVINEDFVHKWWKKDTPQPNITAICGDESGIMVVDTDSEEAEEVVLSLLPTGVAIPTVKTPRGGKHRYFKYRPGLKSKRYIDDLDIKTSGGLSVLPNSQNSNGKYEWLIQPSYDLYPPEFPEDLFNFLKQQDKVKQSETKWDKTVDFNKIRNESFFHVAATLVRGGMGEQNIRYVMETLRQSFGTGDHPFTEKEADKSIESALQRAHTREGSMAAEIYNWICDGGGTFSGHYLDKEFNLTTKRDKANRRKILNRLVVEDFIERVPERKNVFRRIDNLCMPINFLNAEGGELPFKWPLGEEKFFKLMPKNIILVAGSKDTGKTAYLFNVVALNQDRYPIYFFSSEMGDSEFKERLGKHDELELTDWKFNPLSRSGDFHDVIVPDSVNIIDFLQIHDNFYEVGGTIWKIFEKLTTGVAIIGIQKNVGASSPLGGERGIEAARMVILLDPQRPGAVATIKSAKNWRTSDSPIGLKKKYLLLNGINFKERGDWEW